MPEIRAAHGGFYIVEGDITIEQHGTRANAERRLAALKQRAAPPKRTPAPDAAPPPPASAATPAPDSGPETSDADTAETLAAQHLTGTAQEVIGRIAAVTDVALLGQLAAIEEARAGRQVVIEAIQARADAL